MELEVWSFESVSLQTDGWKKRRRRRRRETVKLLECIDQVNR